MKHGEDPDIGWRAKNTEMLKGTRDKFTEWDAKGYRIILTTGRRESERSRTEAQLQQMGLIWDLLVMGLGPGIRVLINDIKPHSLNTEMAVAINLKRNQGLSEVHI